jgi:hypothetical protein
MNSPKILDSNGIVRSSMDYQFLFEKGLEYIQQLSGENWTDYNYHDPGITILEQLCYAITDLSYRANFSIQDLLSSQTDLKGLKESNFLFGPHEVFPSSPLTLNDYSYLLIEQIEEVKYAWVKSVNDSQYGFSGLVDVLIQLDEETDDNAIFKIKSDIKSKILANRSLCFDLNEIQILSKEIITIEANLSIDSFSLGEKVLAEIYDQIERIFNPDVVLYELEEMIEKGFKTEHIFSGILPKYGFIEPNSLKAKTSEIYVSQIQQIIESVDGVLGISDLIIYKNGIRQFGDLISFSDETYPFFDKHIKNYHISSDRISLYRNYKEYKIDTVILSQLYDAISLTSKRAYKKTIIFSDNFPKGSFSTEEIKEYYSIQNEFPSAYKLKTDEISDSTDSSSIANVRQLKAFLYLFDQVMANYLAHLAGLRSFFSVRSPHDFSEFVQIPSDIDDLVSILKSGNFEGHKEALQTLAYSDVEFLEIKDKVLNHLLSRFSESFDSSILFKIAQSEFNHMSTSEIKLYILNLKKRYATDLLNLSKTKSKAFNYLDVNWETTNISGLEHRLKLLIGIESLAVRSCTFPLVDVYHNERSKAGFNWKIRNLRLLSGTELEVDGLTYKEYLDFGASFKLNSFLEFNDLFLEAHRRQNYRIIGIEKNKESSYCLLFSSGRLTRPTLVYEHIEEEKCKQVLNKLIQHFIELNRGCENVFLVENILLRPRLSNNYETIVFDAKRNDLLKSANYSSKESLLRLRDDVLVITSNKDNYIVEKINGQFVVTVNDLFQIPRFRFTKEFKTEKEALRIINDAVTYFKELREKKIDVEDFTEIHKQESYGHEFPVDFNYSNAVSIVLPSWPYRFQNDEFRQYIENSIKEYIPSHIKFSLYYLDIEEMYLFEELYKKWVETLQRDDSTAIDLPALELVQFLKKSNSRK